MKAAVDPYIGIDEPDVVDDAMQIWPNPASGSFQVGRKPGTVPAEVQLVDAMGRTVRQWEGSNGPLSVQGIAAGIYVVRMVGRSGEPLAVGRLMVQH
jgi:hypothetical protein